jgi:hypothetical protein
MEGRFGKCFKKTTLLYREADMDNDVLRWGGREMEHRVLQSKERSQAQLRQGVLESRFSGVSETGIYIQETSAERKHLIWSL